MKKVFYLIALFLNLIISIQASLRAPPPGYPDAMLGSFFSNYVYSDCVICNQNNLQSSYPLNSLGSSYGYPWWSQYGALSYPNFYYPSAWSNNGVNSSYYTGHGGGFAGKPNIYITAPDGEKIFITIFTAEDSNLLLTVPAYEGGWKTLVKDNKFIVDDVVHDYLFYDVRFDEQFFSAESGFCGNRQLVIEEMMAVLLKLSFKPQEIKDFYDYWSIKLPRSQKYCVFPQFNEENDKAYKLQISNLNNSKISLTRVTFMITVEEAMNEESKQKFYRQPKNNTAYLERIKMLSSQQKEKIWLREWAVAFTLGK